MSDFFWKTSFASVIGTSHSKQGTCCQDAGGCIKIQMKDNKEVLLAMVADGAGSASKSNIGSQLTVNLFFKEFKESITTHNTIKHIDRDFVIEWLKLVRNEISIQAKEAGVTTNEFACTVIGAIVCLEEAIFFQIGDGAIVVSKNNQNDYCWMFWPQHGEFANQTNFIVQNDFLTHLKFEYLNEQFDKIALFTDGIERLVLDFTAFSVHAPAFTSIFEWLANKEPSNCEIPCPGLTAYLNSDFINNRTDDDKTLVMAVRSLPELCRT